MRPLILAALLAIASTTHAAVGGSWDGPGEHPFTGSPFSAVMSYSHIPYLDRLSLAYAVRHTKPHARIEITRTEILGEAGVRYSSALNGMHFARGVKAGDNISRAGWAADHTELASAWCRGSWCIVVPDVCNNVSWTVREILPTYGLHTAPRRVPEPASIALVLSALLGAAIFTNRKARRAHR